MDMGNKLNKEKKEEEGKRVVPLWVVDDRISKWISTNFVLAAERYGHPSK